MGLDIRYINGSKQAGWQVERTTNKQNVHNMGIVTTAGPRLHQKCTLNRGDTVQRSKHYTTRSSTSQVSSIINGCVNKKPCCTVQSCTVKICVPSYLSRRLSPRLRKYQLHGYMDPR